MNANPSLPVAAAEGIDPPGVPLVESLPRSPSVWAQAWARLRRDRVGIVSLWIVGAFLVLVVLAQVGLLAGGWQREVGEPFAPPTFVGAQAREAAKAEAPALPNVDLTDIDPLAPYYKQWAERAAQVKTVAIEKSATLPFGGDRIGRDVLSKAVKGAQVSILVGIAAAFLATLIGTVLGAVAGYFGGKLDDLLEWVYNVFTSIPYILLIFALAAVFKYGPMGKVFSSSIVPVVLILGIVGWTGIYRLVRAEYIKHRGREYVRAAESIGASHAARMFGHILPNISHVVLVQLSLHVVSFIKAEVILSFLGLGVPIDMVSWGTMLAEAQTELVLGKWWQLVAATAFMATFVTAFALLTDALRDAMDPKLR
ncbi:ABC transporter permease [Caenimonas aquaedulcis]|uniref:ABC transporter permease n=1 Tax=Caenimonas aquaedulcis TaxID=2793270 RepID=A0A931H3M2_9BURK|nr:ABC transporter permease [Caenimonas aquaedulcis]MBG9387922.1 ABC transporter permease [Caenimonas aquaedulcis]